MKLKYLGTAAAEAIPALFCNCDACRYSREAGGRNIRTRSQAVVDGKILIDFPPDCYWHSIRFGLDYSTFTTLLITHTHPDHLQPMEVARRNPGYAHLDGLPQLTVYGSQDLHEKLDAYSHPELAPLSFAVVTVKPFEPFTVEDGYEITALPAVHGTEHPYNYLIRHGEKSLLYLHDSYFPTEETLKYLKKTGICFSLVSMDCTMCANVLNPSHKHSHMSIHENVLLRQRMLDDGMADEKTVFVVNHFSHNGKHSPYDEMVPVAAEKGFEVSYDGMEIEF